MQRFRVVYHRISHEAVLFSQRRVCIPIKYKCYTVLYHAIESTVANTIKATYVRRMMVALGEIASNIQCIVLGKRLQI